MIRIGRNLLGASGVLAALAMLTLLPSGCSHGPSTQQAVDAQLESLHLEREALGRFAGRVTIDGQPPTLERGKVFVIMLYNQTHPEKNKPALNASFQNGGKFEFYTYTAGDGVPLGTYVVLFAQLTSSRGRGLVQPDGLKNLYDDPEKNSQDKDFVVTVTQPGKTDYEFNLSLAGKDPVKTPGPHAVTEILKK
jgi:hypothetical protein